MRPMSTCPIRRAPIRSNPRRGNLRRRDASALLAALGLALGAASTVQASELQVRVVDREGQPVSEVVVAARGSRAKSSPAAAQTAVMDQVDRQFVPRILVIQAGTSVAFPNSDTVSHQVYSFSPTKRFQLPLYRGQTHPPLLFPEPGIVVLGCNIHDSMIGYIYVAPGPSFGKTDASGTAVLKDLTADDYELMVWSPRFDEPQGQIRKTVTLGGQSHPPVEIQLTHPLRPELRNKTSDDY